MTEIRKAELMKRLGFLSDLSDGQKISIMIHFRLSGAAFIFSAFVPVTPSAPLAKPGISCTREVFAKMHFKIWKHRDGPTEWIVHELPQQRSALSL